MWVIENDTTDKGSDQLWNVLGFPLRLRHIHSYSRYNPSKNKRAENSDHTRNSRSQNSQDLSSSGKKINGTRSLQQPPRVRNNTERKMYRMYNRKGMGIK